MISFLQGHISVFGWSVHDLVRIDPQVITHHLLVDPSYPPIKQKGRVVTLERSRIVSKEVDRLLGTRHIPEVVYSIWIANTIVVTKKGNKWWVCIDYIDLNKACPKDSFHVPKIDQLVDLTVGNKLLSIMDAYSGYN